MKIYFAVGAREYLYLLFISGVKNILCSYAYPEPYLCKKLLKRRGIKMMVDSGAFTSWTKGIEIKIDDYIQFIKDNIDVIDQERIVGLDVIAWMSKDGAQKTKPTVEDYHNAAQQTYNNWLYMKNKGIMTIPVFHQGENFIWLEKYAKEAPYIGISHNKELDEGIVDKWLYECFYTLKQIGKLEVTKTHAFGLTSPSLLARYPYTSADSATWALTSAFGAILTPYGRVVMSEQKKDDPEFIENLPEHVKKPIIEHIQSFGFSHRLAFQEKGYKYRNLINIEFFLDMEQRLSSQPTIFIDNQQPLFNFLDWDKQRHKEQKQKPIIDETPNYYKTTT